jgi:predicted HicB family RNase H-like nuclease
MEMAHFVGKLEADLAAVAAVGDEATARAAERLIQALRSSAGMRLLEALGDVALEVSAQLPSGHVEVRLSGQDPAFVYIAEEQAEPAAAAEDDGMTARITLRVPESLKQRIEAAAARENVSVNSWLVRALNRSLSSSPVQRSSNRLQGFARG